MKPFVLLAALAVLLSACALVPRESVELSTAVGQDIATLRASHRELARTLFARMKQDVNRFVDDVYAPYQIQFTLARQKERQQKGDPNNLFSVLEIAQKQPTNAQAQKDVLEVTQVLMELVHEDVEDFRRERLAPVVAQEQQVLADLDRVYDQVQRGNAEVTAHLASVVKVHEVQDELLERADLQGLREKIGVGLSQASSRVADFVDTAKVVEGTVDQTAASIEALKKNLDALTRLDFVPKIPEGG